MIKPHKHAAPIKAWADGAEIEALDPFIVGWYTDNSPSWAEHRQYRVKLKPIKWQKEIDAHNRGQAVEYSQDGGKTWVRVAAGVNIEGCRDFCVATTLFRIPHKWQAEKDAQARGKDVQHREPGGEWLDGFWSFDATVGEYRIKPKPRTVKTRLRVAAFGPPNGEGIVWLQRASTDAEAADMEGHAYFLCWLHDWKEIERPVPEPSVAMRDLESAIEKGLGGPSWIGFDLARGDSTTSIATFYNYSKANTSKGGRK